ncbi:hypothetical protein C8T65DRAFT_748576 [Cerioporus squamosus]|nr:hypothetical protein C8T65DRAFT_748576 [Cerioporus squamosus]
MTPEDSSTNTLLELAPPVEITVADEPQSKIRKQRLARNAKAQSKHRAKVKAHILKLEQTVEALQSVLGIVPGQEHKTPPLVLKVQSLERENEALRRQVRQMRRQCGTQEPAGASEYSPSNVTFFEGDGPCYPESSGQGATQAGGMDTVSPHSTRPTLPPLTMALHSGLSFPQRPSHAANYANNLSSSPSNYAYRLPLSCTLMPNIGSPR